MSRELILVPFEGYIVRYREKNYFFSVLPYRDTKNNLFLLNFFYTIYTQQCNETCTNKQTNVYILNSVSFQNFLYMLTKIYLQSQPLCDRENTAIKSSLHLKPVITHLNYSHSSIRYSALFPLAKLLYNTIYTRVHRARRALVYTMHASSNKPWQVQQFASQIAKPPRACICLRGCVTQESSLFLGYVDYIFFSFSSQTSYIYSCILINGLKEHFNLIYRSIISSVFNLCIDYFR